MFGFADYLSIRDLVCRYALYLDRGDFVAMAAMFADAIFTLPAGKYRSDPAGVEAVFRRHMRFYEDGTARSRHVTTYLIVELRDDGRASAEPSVIGLQLVPGSTVRAIVATRDQDESNRVEGEWRFAARRIERNLEGDISLHLMTAIP